MSFSFDYSSMMDLASSIFSGLSPIVWLIGGLSIGVGVLFLVLRLIQNLFGRL